MKGDIEKEPRETTYSSLLTSRGKKHSLATIIVKDTQSGTSRVASTLLTRSRRKGHEVRIIHDAVPPT